MTRQFSSAGLERIFWALEDNLGFIAGVFGEIEPGEFAEMGDILGVNNLAIATPEAPRVTVTGNDRALFTFQFQPTELPSGTLQLGVFDLELATTPTGNKIVDTDGIDGYVFNPDTLNFKNLWLAINSQAKSADSADYGKAGYSVDTRRVQLVPLDRAEYAFQSAANYQWSVVAVPSTRTIFGELMTVDEHGATSGTGIGGQFFDNKVTFGRFVADGTEDEFTLAYPAIVSGGVPLIDIAQLDNDPESLTYGELTWWVYDETPTATGEFGYDAETRVVTLGDAETSGDNLFIRYQRA